MIPGSTAIRDVDVGRHSVRDVLQVQDHRLRQPAHARVQRLRVTVDERGSTGDGGIESLDAPVVQRQHAVLAPLLEEQRLQLSQPLRLLGREISRLRPVVGPVQLPHVVLEGRQRAGSDPRRCVLGDCGPPLVVDAPVPADLEVLRLVRVRCGAVGE
jgi:hypothetical protein